MKKILVIFFASIPFIFTTSFLVNSFIYPTNNEFYLNKVLILISPLCLIIIVIFIKKYGLIFTSIITLITEMILCFSILTYMIKNKKKFLKNKDS